VGHLMPVRPARHKASSATTRQHIVAQDERKSAARRGYGHKWRQARLGYLAKHPLCVHCESKGFVTAANELDHITPHKGDMALFWDSDNWQPLCKRCHSTKTAAEDGGFGRYSKSS